MIGCSCGVCLTDLSSTSVLACGSFGPAPAHLSDVASASSDAFRHHGSLSVAVLLQAEFVNYAVCPSLRLSPSPLLDQLKHAVNLFRLTYLAVGGESPASSRRIV